MTAAEFLAKFPKSKPNSNCLEDVGCHRCGNREEFKVLITTWAELVDDGTVADSDHEYDMFSPIECEKCHHKTLLHEFTFQGLDPLIEQKEKL